MPIDPRFLETEKPPLDPILIEKMRELSQQWAKEDELQIEKFTGSYMRDLISPIASQRFAGQRRALADPELRNPVYRKKLIEKVAVYGKVAQALEFQERAAAGPVGRAAIDLSKAGKTAGEAVSRTGRSFARLGGALGGKRKSREDVQFERALESVRRGEDPESSLIDTSSVIGKVARGAEFAKEGVAQIAPDLIPGTAALKLGGRGLAAGFWAARQFSDSYEDLKEMGASDKQALSLGAGIAAGTGAIEQFIPDPIGVLRNKGIGGAAIRGLSKKVQNAIGKVGLKKLKHPLAKRTAGQVAGALGRTAGETLEEGAQAALDEAVKFNLAARDEAIAERDVSDIGTKAIEAMIEAGPGLLALGAGGAAVGTGEQVSRFKKKAAGFKQSKIETEIIRFAQSRETPTRTQWAKWGVLDVDGHSQKTRKAGVIAIAGRLQKAAQARTIVDRQVPTEQQWKDWGFDPEKGLTREDRKEHLFARFREGYAAEVKDRQTKRRVAEELRQRDAIAADTVRDAKATAKTEQDAAKAEQDALGTPEGLAGVLGQVEGIQDATQPSEAAQELPAALGFADTLANAVQPAMSVDLESEIPVTQEGGLSAPEVILADVETDSPVVEPVNVTDEVDVTDSVKKINNVIGNFIQDTAGRIGIDIEKAGRGLKKAKGIGARFALSRGEFPQSVFEAKIEKEGFESKIETRLRFTVKKFRKLEKKVFGKNGMSNDDIVIVNAALKGDAAAMNSLDLEIRLVISEMRQQVDALSAQLRSMGVITGDLAVIVKSNEGTYLTTTYRAFQGPKWAEDIPQEIKNAYADFIRKEFPDSTNEEINGMIDKILYDAEQSGSPMAMAKQARLGAKDVSILTRKKDLPDELKALLGEETDPILNYAMSVTKLGSLIANHQFQMDIRDANGGEYFSKNAISGTDKGNMVVEIELANETFHTTPELKAALDREYQRDSLLPWLRHYMKANAAVKISKTLLSQQAQVRNIEANILLSVANGHWRLGMLKPAWKATWANFTGKGSKQTQNLIESAVEYQVVGQDVRAGELADLVNDAANSVDIESHVYSYEAKRASIVKKALRKGLRVAARAYQAGDDFFKLYAWLNERARYKKAYPNATLVEIKQKAAEVVRNTFPNYSLIPEGVKQIRRFPIVGSFVSFRSEMIRTSYKILLLIRKEIANPETRKIGYTRLAGTSTAAIAIVSLADSLRLFYKVSKQDEEDLRNFLPDYQKNSTLAHTTGNVDGEFGIIDLTYVDPHGSFRQIWNAFVLGDDLEDKVLGALEELFKPFISDEILFAKLIDVRRNRKESGTSIYNEEDNLSQITGDIVAHIWDAFEPGSVTTVERGTKGLTGYVSERGQTYSAAVEAGAAFLGQRVSNRNIRNSFPFVLGKLSKRKGKAEDILNDVMTRGGKVSDNEITEAYDSSTSAREAIFTEMSKVSNAAVRLLKSPGEVSRMLTASSISVRDKKSILTEVYFRKVYTDAFWSKVRTANPEEFVRRRATLFRLNKRKLENNKKRTSQE